MKKNKKTKDETKMLRIRVIVSSILLVGFIVGWIIYGISLVRTDPKNVLKKFFKQDIDIKITDNMNYSLDNSNIGLYHKDDKLYIYGNNKYMDISEYFKDNGLNVNYKELFDRDNNVKLINGIRTIVINSYDYVENKNNYLEISKIYAYNYTFNTSYLIVSLTSDKEMMDILEKMFGADKETIVKFLNKYNDRRIEYSLYTKGRKRNIEHYSIKVDGLFSIYRKDKQVTGYIGDIVYNIDDNKLSVYVEENEKELTKSDIDINFDEYTKIDINNNLSELLK